MTPAGGWAECSPAPGRDGGHCPEDIGGWPPLGVRGEPEHRHGCGVGPESATGRPTGSAPMARGRAVGSCRSEEPCDSACLGLWVSPSWRLAPAAGGRRPECQAVWGSVAGPGGGRAGGDAPGRLRWRGVARSARAGPRVLRTRRAWGCGSRRRGGRTRLPGAGARSVRRPEARWRGRAAGGSGATRQTLGPGPGGRAARSRGGWSAAVSHARAPRPVPFKVP